MEPSKTAALLPITKPSFTGVAEVSFINLHSTLRKTMSPQGSRLVQVTLLVERYLQVSLHFVRGYCGSPEASQDSMEEVRGRAILSSYI